MRFLSAGSRSESLRYAVLASGGLLAAIGVWLVRETLTRAHFEGYALVASSDVRAADGTAGRELSFGHDEQGKPYVYRIRLFVRGAQMDECDVREASHLVVQCQRAIEILRHKRATGDDPHCFVFPAAQQPGLTLSAEDSNTGVHDHAGALERQTARLQGLQDPVHLFDETASLVELADRVQSVRAGIQRRQ